MRVLIRDLRFMRFRAVIFRFDNFADKFRNIKDSVKMQAFYGKDREKIEKILEIILIESRGVNPYKEYFIETCLNMLITMVVNKIMTTEGRTDEWEELENSLRIILVRGSLWRNLQKNAIIIHLISIDFLSIGLVLIFRLL